MSPNRIPTSHSSKPANFQLSPLAAASLMALGLAAATSSWGAALPDVSFNDGTFSITPSTLSPTQIQKNTQNTTFGSVNSTSSNASVGWSGGSSSALTVTDNSTRARSLGNVVSNNVLLSAGTLVFDPSAVANGQQVLSPAGTSYTSTVSAATHTISNNSSGASTGTINNSTIESQTKLNQAGNALQADTTLTPVAAGAPATGSSKQTAAGAGVVNTTGNFTILSSQKAESSGASNGAASFLKDSSIGISSTGNGLVTGQQTISNSSLSGNITANEVSNAITSTGQGLNAAALINRQAYDGQLGASSAATADLGLNSVVTSNQIGISISDTNNTASSTALLDLNKNSVQSSAFGNSATSNTSGVAGNRIAISGGSVNGNTSTPTTSASAKVNADEISLKGDLILGNQQQTSKAAITATLGKAGVNAADASKGNSINVAADKISGGSVSINDNTLSATAGSNQSSNALQFSNGVNWNAATAQLANAQSTTGTKVTATAEAGTVGLTVQPDSRATTTPGIANATATLNNNTISARASGNEGSSSLSISANRITGPAVTAAASGHNVSGDNVSGDNVSGDNVSGGVLINANAENLDANSSVNSSSNSNKVQAAASGDNVSGALINANAQNLDANSSVNSSSIGNKVHIQIGGVDSNAAGPVNAGPVTRAIGIANDTSITTTLNLTNNANSSVALGNNASLSTALNGTEISTFATQTNTQNQSGTVTARNTLGEAVIRTLPEVGTWPGAGTLLTTTVTRIDNASLTLSNNSQQSQAVGNNLSSNVNVGNGNLTGYVADSAGNNDINVSNSQTSDANVSATQQGLIGIYNPGTTVATVTRTNDDSGVKGSNLVLNKNQQTATAAFNSASQNLNLGSAATPATSVNMSANIYNTQGIILAVGALQGSAQVGGGVGAVTPLPSGIFIRNAGTLVSSTTAVSNNAIQATLLGNNADNNLKINALTIGKKTNPELKNNQSLVILAGSADLTSNVDKVTVGVNTGVIKGGTVSISNNSVGAATTLQQANNLVSQNATAGSVLSSGTLTNTQTSSADVINVSSKVSGTGYADRLFIGLTADGLRSESLVAPQVAVTSNNVSAQSLGANANNTLTVTASTALNAPTATPSVQSLSNLQTSTLLSKSEVSNLVLGVDASNAVASSNQATVSVRTNSVQAVSGVNQSKNVLSANAATLGTGIELNVENLQTSKSAASAQAQSKISTLDLSISGTSFSVSSLSVLGNSILSQSRANDASTTLNATSTALSNSAKATASNIQSAGIQTTGVIGATASGAVTATIDNVNLGIRAATGDGRIGDSSTASVSNNSLVATALVNNVTQNVSLASPSLKGAIGSISNSQTSDAKNTVTASVTATRANVYAGAGTVLANQATFTGTFNDNQFSALAAQNDASNTLNASGDAIQNGSVASTSKDYSISSTQLANGTSTALLQPNTGLDDVNPGPASSKAKYTVDYNFGITAASNNLENSTIVASIANNRLLSQSLSNRTDNTINVNSLAGIQAQINLGNTQTSNSTASNTSTIGGTSVTSGGLNPTITTTPLNIGYAGLSGDKGVVALNVNGNSLQSFSGGNQTTNTLLASAAQSFSVPTGGKTGPAIALNNTQTNAASQSATTQFASFGLSSATSAAAATGLSSLAVNGNTASATAYGNSASNLVSLTSQASGLQTIPGNSLVAALTNSQTNTGAITAKVDSVTFGSLAGTYTNVPSAIPATVAGNSVLAQAIGNSAVNTFRKQ